jgi:altronate dehydratase
MVLGEHKKPLKSVVVQDVGGSRKAADLIEGLAREMMDELAAMPRVEAGPSDLLVALECGGSDTFSGMTANPAVGRAVDRLAASGSAIRDDGDDRRANR